MGTARPAPKVERLRLQAEAFPLRLQRRQAHPFGAGTARIARWQRGRKVIEIGFPGQARDQSAPLATAGPPNFGMAKAASPDAHPRAL
ncbi:hypothetical protein C7B82_04575, partial [Stenomitos frigidus ULC18]